MKWIVNSPETHGGAMVKCIINNPAWFLSILPLSLVRHLATLCVINRYAVPCECLIHRSSSSPVVGIQAKVSGS